MKWFEVKLAYENERVGVVTIRHTLKALDEIRAVERVLDYHALDGIPHVSATREVGRPVTSRIFRSIIVGKTLDDIDPNCL